MLKLCRRIPPLLCLCNSGQLSNARDVWNHLGVETGEALSTMAEIVVEKKRNMGWLMWLLIALAVALLLWWIFRGMGRDADMTAERGRVADTAGPITDAAMLYGTADATQYVGRQVQLQNARVLSVTGDANFWVGEAEGRQLLVRLDEQPTPNQPATEGRYDVNPGQTVNVYGDVRAFPGWSAVETEWKLDSSLRSNFENQRVYVHANRLDIVSRP